jgi:hypothetical protein
LLRRRAVLPLVILGLVPPLVGLIWWSSLGGRDAQRSSQADATVAAWFEEYPRHEPLPPKEVEHLTLGVWKQLSTSVPLQLSEELERDHQPRLIFVSARGDDGATRVSLGHGPGIGTALRDALRRLPRPTSISAVKVDLVGSTAKLARLGVDSPISTDFGNLGLAYDAPPFVALLPDEIVSAGLLDSTGVLDRERTADYLKTSRRPVDTMRLAGRRAAQAYAIGTQSAFFDGTSYHPLYRGHRTYGDLTPSLLLEAATLGGAYLARSVDGQGRFVYLYDAARDHHSEEYNVLRHAGAVYAMLELYEVTRDQALLEAAARALDYLVAQIRPCTLDATSYYCLVENDEIKVGGHGLALLALSTYAGITGSKKHLGVMQGLAGWLAKLQEPNGNFRAHKVMFGSGALTPFQSLYYPGEAIYGLTALYEIDKNPRWLVVARRVARYVVDVRDRGVATEQLPNDHWFLYGIDRLYRQRKDPALLDHAMKVAAAIIGAQNRAPLFPDWVGSYYVPPRSTPAATRSEGMVAAYHLAEDFVGGPRAAEILANILLATHFQLATQIREESMMYLRNPRRALGGFRGAFDNYEVRIDYVQHNISALLGLREILLGREPPDQGRRQRHQRHRDRRCPVRSWLPPGGCSRRTDRRPVRAPYRRHSALLPARWGRDRADLECGVGFAVFPRVRS